LACSSWVSVGGGEKQFSVVIWRKKPDRNYTNTDAHGAKEEQEEEKAGATSVGGVKRETEIC